MSWDQAGGHTAVLFTKDTATAEIYALRERHGMRKLTTHNDALMAELNLVPTEDIDSRTRKAPKSMDC